MKNQVQLITYVDRLGGGDLKALAACLRGPLQGLFGAVHLLPFYDPIDGADAGFDPIDHTRVDHRLGDWQDVHALSQQLDVMADVIVNHASSKSPQFLDWSARGAKSPYDGMFLSLERVFQGEASPTALAQIYRPRPGAPFTPTVLADGRSSNLWTTFTPDQIDIDVEHPCGQQYLDDILRTLSQHGVTMIRLDAVGYAIKRPGTRCFMLPETFAFIANLSERAHALGMAVLVEVHAHHRQQMALAQRVDWVYDFALPPLVLHALTAADLAPLVRWMGMRPANALNVLDTHDGIGIIDIGADAGDREGSPGLVTPAQLNRLVEAIHHNSQGQSRAATGAAASNLDLYQVNCTFYDALGRNDAAYLVARAIQFFMPGIPQVYYVGLLAGENDMALLQSTQVGRDINRHHYQPDDIAAAMQRPVVQALFKLIRLRNSHRAFGGRFEHHWDGASQLTMTWRHDTTWLSLRVDVVTHDLVLQGGPDDKLPDLGRLNPRRSPAKPVA